MKNPNPFNLSQDNISTSLLAGLSESNTGNNPKHISPYDFFNTVHSLLDEATTSLNNLGYAVTLDRYRLCMYANGERLIWVDEVSPLLHSYGINFPIRAITVDLVTMFIHMYLQNPANARLIQSTFTR